MLLTYRLRPTRADTARSCIALDNVSAIDELHNTHPPHNTSLDISDEEEAGHRHRGAPTYDIIIVMFQVLSADSRDGIKIHMQHHSDAAVSYLLIGKAEFTDSGKYTCKPSNAELVSIRVNVLNGELFISG